MSEILPPKSKTVENLEFLNEEVGKAKKVLTDLNSEIDDLKHKKNELQNELSSFSASKSNESMRIDNQLTAKKAELHDVTLAVDASKSELQELTLKVADYKKQSESEFIQQQEKEKFIADKMADLEQRENELVRKERKTLDGQMALNLRATTISKREELIETKAARLENDSKKFEQYQKDGRGNLKVADDMIKAYEIKEQEFNKRETEFQEKQRNLAAERVNFHFEKDRILNTEKELTENIRLLSQEKSDFEKKISALIKRDTDVTLREAECRVREKALNIANREKQLDEQL